MSYLSKLAHRIARLRPSLATVLVTSVGCSQGDRVDFLSPFPNPNKSVLHSVRIEPKIAAARLGAEFAFSATGYSANGDVVPATFEWHAEGGTISSEGRYLGNEPGPFRVIARSLQDPSIADSVFIAVWQNPTDPTAILVQPESITVEIGDTVGFNGALRLADGAVASGAALKWSTSGGQIDQNGRFTALEAGTYRVEATPVFANTAAAQVWGGLRSWAMVVVHGRGGRELLDISLSPKSVSLEPGQTTRFSTTALWSDGKKGSADVEWSATGGSISANGSYTAGSEPGNYSVVAQVADGSLADTASVTVVAPVATLASFTISPKSTSIEVGRAIQFSASARWSDGSTDLPALSWSATGGAIDGNGLYTAGATAGSFRVVVAGGGKADTATVTLTPPPPPTLVSLTVTPELLSLPTGHSYQFAVSTTWSDGTTTLPAITWSETGGDITPSGLYTGGATAGTFRVIASGGGKADTAVVNLTAATVTSFVMTPASTSVAAGATQQFQTAVTWSDGASRPVSVTYNLPGGGGTISLNGLFTAGSVAGAFAVVAACSCGLADTSSVVVTAPVSNVLVSLQLAPDPVNLLTGGAQQFAVGALWSNGSTALPALSWSATGGTVSSTGLYTAGGTAGTYRVIVSGSGKADTATVEVVSSPSPPPPPPPPPPSPPPGCSNPQPGWIWCDDFEQNWLSSYFEYDNDGGDFAAVAGVGTNGSTGMRVRWQAGEVSAGNLKVAFGRTPDGYIRPVDAGTANYREIYWRTYVRNSSSWTGGGADKLSRAMILAGSNWSQAMIAHVWSGGSGSNYLVIDPASGTDEAGNLRSTGYNDGPNLRWLGAQQSGSSIFSAAQVGQWYCVESHVRLNTAGQSDGVFELWINDGLEAQRTGLNWVGSYSAYGINAVFFENYWNSGSPVAQERYIDDVVVSTQRIGCNVSTSSPPPPGSNPTLLSLSLTPSVASLLTGASQLFVATALWSDGSTALPALSWSATGGTVSASGLYTGGATAGTYQVVVSGGGRSATAVVTLSNSVTPPPPPDGSVAPIIVFDPELYPSPSTFLQDSRGSQLEEIGGLRQFLASEDLFSPPHNVTLESPAQGGYNGRTKVMRYHFGAICGNPCDGSANVDGLNNVVSRAWRPLGSQVLSRDRTIWLEGWFRFASNFRASQTFDGSPTYTGAHKFMLLGPLSGGGRYDAQIGGQSLNQITLGTPGIPDANYSIPSSIFTDGQWHRWRVMARMHPTEGRYKYIIDDTVILDLTGDTKGTNPYDAWGAWAHGNSNAGWKYATWMDVGLMRSWTQNPGW